MDGSSLFSTSALQSAGLCDLGLCEASTSKIRLRDTIVAGEPVSSNAWTETPSISTSVVSVGPNFSPGFGLAGVRPCIVAVIVFRAESSNEFCCGSLGCDTFACGISWVETCVPGTTAAIRASLLGG